MAVLQVARGLTLMLLVFNQGCHSQQPQCGVAVNNNRIVGGQNAVPDHWPWFAALKISGVFRCGGTLINNQWVLTAARCLLANQANDTEVLLGLHSISNPGADVVNMTLDEVICHPDYNSSDSTFENDICLLKLSAPVNFSESIQPICLSSRNSTFHTGVRSWVTGFGFTGNYTPADVLQEVNVPIMGNNQCACYSSYRQITDNMICVGNETGKGSCLGDAGGPLMIKTSTSWVQVGVSSFDRNCGFFQNPGVYTRVSRYEDWIKETVNGSDVGFVNFTSPGVDPDSSFICHPTSTPPPYPTSPPPYYTTSPPPYYTTSPPPYYTTSPPPYYTTSPPPYYTTSPPPYYTTSPPPYYTTSPPPYYTTSPPPYYTTSPPPYYTTSPPPPNTAPPPPPNTEPPPRFLTKPSPPPSTTYPYDVTVREDDSIFGSGEI